MTNKQKEALSKFYFNVALLALGSLVFRVVDIEVVSFVEVMKTIVGLTMMIGFLILGLTLAKGEKYGK